MQNIKYQGIKITGITSGSNKKLSISTDKLYEKITGVCVSLPYEQSLFGTCCGVKVAGEEIFPIEHEVRFLSSSQDVAPDDKFYSGTSHNKFELEARGSQVELDFTDGAAVVGVTYPYTAIVYLRLENITVNNNSEPQK